MDLLLISNEDICRSRIAQELLNSFGRGLKITTAGVAEGSAVPDVVCNLMQHKGYEVSRKKPTHVSAYIDREWDFVIALSKDAAEELKMMNLQTEHKVDLLFDDPLENMTLTEEEQQEKVDVLYQNMNKKLYEFYRDVISEMLMPRCTCGANTYCRCE